ncbi:MAG: radical SAM protein [Elusimicrobia bacterium]|nr:radical SAM protein [Elusimicrobiota bacterium]
MILKRRFGLGHWAAAGKAAFLAAACGRRTPLAVSYLITNRCNSCCAYCDRWRKAGPELSTEQVFELLLGLRRLGTRFLQITGGEPFLREDLPAVAARARELGMHVGVNTNGSLIEERAEVLSCLDHVCLSLDGPPEVHEKIRPRGSHGRVERAVEFVKSRGVPVSLTATLTKFNTDCVDYLLDFAAARGVPLSFQPADVHALSSLRDNETVAETERVRAAFALLAERKERHDCLENGLLELAYMRKWPEQQGVDCAGARLFCRIESDGDVMVCGLKEQGRSHPNILRDGLAAALSSVPLPDCRACFCSARLRMNILYSAFRLNRRVLLDLLKGGGC